MDLSTGQSNEQQSKAAKGGNQQAQNYHQNNNGDGDQAGDCEVIGDDVISLPKEVIRRVNALKNIQIKMVDVETKFYEELHLLECKYSKLYDEFYAQREKIVSGNYEPNDEEAKFVLDAVDELATEVKEKIKIEEEKKEIDEKEAQVKGIPDFWLHAMKSTDILGTAIQEHDEPILRHLKDIRVRMKDKKPYGYTIEFYFDENEYFTNKVLTKMYELTVDKDERDPFGYDGPALYKSVGCKIDWNKGKDVTTRVVKKRQKHKSTGTIRVVSKEEKQDSFFNFFESPTPDGIRPSYKSITSPSQFKKDETEENANNKDEEEMNEEDEELYEADFEIGHFLKEFLIPKAVLYYTGELIDEANYEDEEEYDEEGLDEDDDEAELDNEDDDEGENVDDDDDGLDEERKRNQKVNKKHQQQSQGKSKRP